MAINTTITAPGITKGLSCNLLMLAILLCATFSAGGQRKLIQPVAIEKTPIPKDLKYPALVLQFYELNGHKLFWLQPGEEAKSKRAAFQILLDHCAASGLSPSYYDRSVKLGNYAYTNITGVSGQELLTIDMIFTDAAISFFKDLYQGPMMNKWVSYDELSTRCAAADNATIIADLQQVKTDQELSGLAARLEPQDNEYSLLKTALAHEMSNGDLMKMKQLISSMNYYRWIHHFKLGEFVVVNIGSATIKYYNADSEQLRMRAVVGTPNAPTPRFASYCSQVVLYPYWNVPRSIALDDLLPRFQRSPAQLELLNMEVLDGRGKVVDPKKIKWASLNKHHFPYRFREKTGCVNPLGVVKLDITDPFSVYIHDTNFRGAFLAKNRYYSHGCIRVEEPVALAIALLRKPVDTAFLQACYKDMKPVTLQLPRPVPVFVVYMTAEVNEVGVVQYYKDQYRLL